MASPKEPAAQSRGGAGQPPPPPADPKYHWAPPGFYLVSFFATFWPGAILAAIAVPFAWIHRREEPGVQPLPQHEVTRS